jgi:HSP20 family protein
MASQLVSIWMWAEACQNLDRAERLQRRFFELGEAAERPCWEPPLDVFESERELAIVIALPGVAAADVTVNFVGDALVVAAERRLPRTLEGAVIRRLELPHGHFERRIPLPAERYELARRELRDGCLQLVLRKIS